MITNFYIKDGEGFKETKLRYCTTCMHTHMEHRDTCWTCGPWFCTRCKCEMPDRHYTACKACLLEESEFQESVRFSAAEKLTEWDGPVYDGSEFYASIEDMIEAKDCDGIDVPEYVWACDLAPVVNLNKDMLTDEGVVQEPYDDFNPDDIVIPELMTKAIEEFNEANKHLVSWSPNFKKAVVINQEVPNA